MAIFKAYDIRGVFGEQLHPIDARRIGRATARFIGASTLVVGRDARSSSPQLFDELVSGINDEGVDVIDLGLVSTPMVYLAVERLGVGGGIMITASHNPGQYNGFKICREHAIPIGEASGLKEIEKLAESIVDDPPKPNRGGSRAHDIVADYTAHALSAGEGRPNRRVAIDCGNGMASVGLVPVLEKLDLEVEALYFDPDCSFPNHEADPLKLENLRDVSAAVLRTKADFGVAFDGDADRAVFVDDQGEPIPSDLTTGLLAPRQLARDPKAPILYDLRSSRVTAEEIEAAGGTAQMCRVGHSFVKAQMREVGAIFAGELSGHFYFRFSDTLFADDGVAAFVAMLDVLANDDRPLSEIIRPLRRYSASGEINRRVPDIGRVLADIEATHADAPFVSHLDGLLVRYPTWWFNVRASNTEPVIRLNLEADTEAMMIEKRDAILDQIGGS